MFVCLYGASSNQISSEYICLTETLGSMLADAGYSLVYGAGGAGLMGAAARGFKEKNGYVIGVVPRFLQVDGILYPHCDEIIFTETMRQRKQAMEEKADAFIVTPGGIGTFEEFFEIYTLKQLGRHRKPIIVYNINGYYDAMLAMLSTAVEQSFMRETSMQLITVVDTPQEVVKALTDDNAPLQEIRQTKYV